MITRIYKFLLNQVKSKYIVAKIIELSGNGYFFEYFKDPRFMTFINEDILVEIICSYKKKSDKNFYIFSRHKIENLFFDNNKPAKLVNYLKNTKKI